MAAVHASVSPGWPLPLSSLLPPAVAGLVAAAAAAHRPLALLALGAAVRPGAAAAAGMLIKARLFCLILGGEGRGPCYVDDGRR